MSKKFQYMFLGLNIINVIIITITFIILNIDEYYNHETDYVMLILFLIITLFELIYLIYNLKNKISTRKFIVWVLIFIIQTSIMFAIPIYMEDIGCSDVLPRNRNAYGYIMK